MKRRAFLATGGALVMSFAIRRAGAQGESGGAAALGPTLPGSLTKLPMLDGWIRIDAQGRVLVPAVLRNVAAIADDVVVLGNNDHLIVWNEERIQRRLAEAPMSAEDYKELELHGV